MKIKKKTRVYLKRPLSLKTPAENALKMKCNDRKPTLGKLDETISRKIEAQMSKTQIMSAVSCVIQLYLFLSK